MHVISYPSALSRFISSIIFVWDIEGINSFLVTKAVIVTELTISHVGLTHCIISYLLVLQQLTLNIQLEKQEPCSSSSKGRLRSRSRVCVGLFWALIFVSFCVFRWIGKHFLIL